MGHRRCTQCQEKATEWIARVEYRWGYTSDRQQNTTSSSIAAMQTTTSRKARTDLRSHDERAEDSAKILAECEGTQTKRKK
jgi:uncharacterized protein YndB with AHSA1/START domain